MIDDENSNNLDSVLSKVIVLEIKVEFHMIFQKNLIILKIKLKKIKWCLKLII